MNLMVNMVLFIGQLRKGFLVVSNRVALVSSISIFTPFHINDPTDIRLGIQSGACNVFLKMISITSSSYWTQFWTHSHLIILNFLPFAVDPIAFPDASKLYIIKFDLSVKKCQLAVELAYIVILIFDLELLFDCNVAKMRNQMLLTLLGDTTVYIAILIFDLELSFLQR